MRRRLVGIVLLGIAAFMLGLAAPRTQESPVWRVLVRDDDGTYVVRGRIYQDRTACYRHAAYLDRTSDVSVTCALVGR